MAPPRLDAVAAVLAAGCLVGLLLSAAAGAQSPGYPGPGAGPATAPGARLFVPLAPRDAADAATPTPAGDGVEVVIEWQDEADLDLHVADPAGDELSPDHPTTASGGVLQSGRGCRPGSERATWPLDRAPAGQYAIRVYQHDCKAAARGAQQTRPVFVPFTIRTRIKNGNAQQVQAMTAGPGQFVPMAPLAVATPAAGPSSPVAFVINPLPPNGTVGEPYFHSFCRPARLGLQELCDPNEGVTNPTGGHPPYHFQLDTAGGFPPFGLVLAPNGVLSGTPSAAGARAFSVCAVDLDANSACAQVNLTIGLAAPPTATPTPTPTKTPTRTPTPSASCSTGGFANTTWTGSFQQSFYDEATQDGTFTFAFGPPDCGFDRVYVTSATATARDSQGGTRTYSLDTDPDRPSYVICYASRCNFSVRMRVRTGSETVLPNDRWNVDPLTLSAEVASPPGATTGAQVIATTLLKGPASAGCCQWGTYTANRG